MTTGIKVKRKINIRRLSLFDVFNYMFMALLALIVIFPFYYVFIVSFAEWSSYQKQAIYILPNSFSLSAYQLIFKDSFIIRPFFNTVFVAVAGTLLSMFLSIMAGYALTKKNIPGNRIIFLLIVFTMYFSGGLIPYYMTVKTVGLYDSIFVMIIPLAVNTYYLILMRNYFKTITPSLEEAARIDGANDFTILWQILVPTSAPIIATFSLFYAVDRWNEWWTALIFLQSRKLFPLQLVLREVMFDFQQLGGTAMAQHIASTHKTNFEVQVQTAIIVIVSIPIMLVYPFLQKYFAKGVMVGSVKE